jgi:lysozyme family protein
MAKSGSGAKGDFDKRGFLKAAGGVIAAAAIAPRAFAQDGKILGLEVPREILDILPRKPLNYVRLADTVLRLEREADRKGLPDSPLAFGKGQSITDVANSLYQSAMPRLVALIDRSESIDPGFSDKAGELLAQLHLSQHELPELLQLAPKGLDGVLKLQPGRTSLFMQDSGMEAVPAPVVIQPAEPPVEAPAEPPVEAPAEQPPVIAEPAPEPEKPALPKPEEEPDRPLSKARDYASLKEEYGRKFRKLEVRPQYRQSADWHLAMVRKSKPRYERVENATGVPWFFIAVTHGLEASFNFRAHLHNGDFPLTARTRQVPAGRPSVWLPPSDWESSAKDALRLLGYTGQKDWSLERTLYRLEAYNGLGYRSLGVPTPYLWSFSNQYDRGKYVADGKFSYTAKSQQCGAAVILKMLAEAGEIKLEPAA